jgi:hypothetical protein
MRVCQFRTRGGLRSHSLRQGSACSPALFRSSLDRNLKGKAQEFDGSVHLIGLPQRHADPATVGKVVVCKSRQTFEF